MKKQEIIYLLIGLIVGIIMTLSLSAYAVNGDHRSMMRAMGLRYNQNYTNTTVHHSENCTSTQCSVPAE